jgi:thiosulfate dehydrogenase [quinone] large subunit
MNVKQNMRRPAQGIVISDPPLAQALFEKTSWAWIWIIPRLYVGWEWLSSGWGKINNPAWVGSKAGTALTGFVSNALTKATGAHPDVQNIYAAFLQQAVLPNAATWSYVVAFGETLVGIGLILGVLSGIVAFFGIFMNLNYLMAGTVSVNPILLVISIFLLLAWKTAGWWGLDRWVLPALGTPWSPGQVFRKGTGE